MSNIIDFNKYLSIKKEKELEKFIYSDPTNELFKEKSKFFQKDYPVLKYLCEKSKFNKIKKESDQIEGIYDLPKNYFNYIYEDIMSNYLEIGISSNFNYENSDLNEYYCTLFKYRSLNEFDNEFLNYHFLLSGHIIKNILNLFD